VPHIMDHFKGPIYGLPDDGIQEVSKRLEGNVSFVFTFECKFVSIK
jgi:hypothetical protein